jgi:hypothetical protein
MKQIKDIFPIILLLLSGLASCSTDELPDNNDKEKTPVGSITSLQISVSDFKGKVNTRTSESGYQTSFTGDDQIGVFALYTSTNTVVDDNIPYKYDSSNNTWQPVNTGMGSNIYVYGSGVTYYAYYPYSSAMNGKKSIAEIVSAFTPAKDQSTYAGYTSADLMTGTGILNGNTLTIGLTHAMTLVEVSISETTNHTPYNGEPTFYGTKPWKTPSGLYRYLVVPNVEATVAFEHGPTENRYSFYEKITAANVNAGQYISVTAPFDNSCVMLNTGAYIGNMGTLSKVVINGTSYPVTPETNNNSYMLYGMKQPVSPITSLDIYIYDNLASPTEQLLLSVTPAKITVNATSKTITIPLSAGGMEGAGTSAADPYLVTTPPQLRGVDAEGANDNSAETEYYEQKADLDLSAYDNWKPVKSGALYDGKGYKVNNLVSTQGGIFSYNGGTIQNVHLVSGNINSTNGNIGGIVNVCDRSGINQTIQNCSNAANITAGGWTGGIVGNGSYSTIEHCKNSGNISSTVSVGGIFGHIWGDAHVRYCYNEGLIKVIGSGNDNPVGGIGGQIYSSAYGIEYSYNKGDVQNDVTGEAGSILGRKSSGDGSNNYGIQIFNNKIYGSNNNSNTEILFDNTSNIWPAYTADSSNGWGSSHWKSYNQGEYPQLLWEP